MGMQLNSKTTKVLKDSLALWHIAKFAIDDNIVICNNAIKSLTTGIDTNLGLIEKLQSGEKIMGNKTEADLRSEIDSFNASIKTKREELAKFKKEQETDLKKGTDLISDELVASVKASLSDVYDENKASDLIKSLVKFFTDNGVAKVTDSDVMPFVRALGVKPAKGKSALKGNSHIRVGSDSEIRDIILGTLCNEPNLKKSLPTYKWVSVIEKKVKNK